MNQAESRDDSARLRMPAKPKVEVDLYDDLVSFSVLPPKDRVKAAPDSRSIDLKGESITPSVHAPDPQRGPVSDQLAKLSNQQTNAVLDQTAEATVPQASSVSHQPTPAARFSTAPEAVESPASPTSVEPNRPPVNAQSEFQFTGAISPGVCVGCGSESGSDDLFCAECAEFVDEAEELPASPANCVECGLRIASDEVICPRCGAVFGS